MSVFPLRRRARPPALPDLAAALPLPVVVVDAGGTVIHANAAAETFFNASLGTLGERGLSAAALADLVAKARAEGSDVAAYDTAVTVDGRTGRADVFVTPLADPAGATMVALLPHPAALAGRQRLAEGASRSAIGIAAMLAHEIKNPLSGIRGAAQLLGQGAAGDGDASELTDLICREVDRVAALIDRMEDFTDTRPLAKGAENIHAVLGHVRQIAASGFAAGIPIRERYDPSLPPVAGNHDALVQVFLNLVKNAAEAVDTMDGAGREIVLTTAYRHGFRVTADGAARPVALPLEVCVVDNGPGASPDVARHLFAPFVSSKRGGGGLGLALVAKIVGDHGGIVEYERAADPPRTIFRVLLPIA